MSATGTTSQIRFRLTGSVAHARLSPLLPSDWVDTETAADDDDNNNEMIPDFLWENGPRLETKQYRDNVKVYSHLPNGSNILDSKWVLGRLFSDAANNADEESSRDPLLATLETHCFRGLDGFAAFGNKVDIFSDVEKHDGKAGAFQYADILDGSSSNLKNVSMPKAPSNLWIVKDAMCNGAGGIWVVGPENAAKFGAKETSPLYPDDKYVAQRYVWPPVLYGGRKCHVRVYGLLTSDRRAFVHKRAFLHVANDAFTTKDANESGSFQDSIHITNCCANSHDDSKFAGEILADFEATEETNRDGQPVVPLAQFFPSIQACVAALAKRSFPFLQGGQANNGFEYLGMDFMLSYNEQNLPIAYMLEVNAPPSQDTATGLPHAENLHDDVIRDLINLWVVPKVTGATEILGGWRGVFSDEPSRSDSEPIVPSKGAIINKIRWAMFEKKMQRHDQQQDSNDSKKDEENEDNKGTQDKDVQNQAQRIAQFARSQFPFYSNNHLHHHHSPQVFLENAGGSQVAQPVVDAMTASLIHRHRSVVGSKTKIAARETFRRLLGAEDHPVFLGSNATSLLATLADRYVEFGLLSNGDELVISTENHQANFEPWIRAAKASGATVKFWIPYADENVESNKTESSADLKDLVSPRTRIVAIPHASNILGQIRDIAQIARIVKVKSKGRAHLVVDGVAAAPHWFAAFDQLNVDWYVVSCHKMFGPHLGALCAKREGAVEEMFGAVGSSSCCDASKYSLLEKGTLNYEGCAGIVGLGKYFKLLSSFDIHTAEESGALLSSQVLSGEACSESNVGLPLGPTHMLSMGDVKEAYRRIRIAEEHLVNIFLRRLSSSKKVTILQSKSTNQKKKTAKSMARLPTFAFIHSTISARDMYDMCDKKGIVSRYSFFLCNKYLARDFGFEDTEGVLRLSLAHYNTHREISFLFDTLESFPGWF